MSLKTSNFSFSLFSININQVSIPHFTDVLRYIDYFIVKFLCQIVNCFLYTHFLLIMNTTSHHLHLLSYFSQLLNEAENLFLRFF